MNERRVASIPDCFPTPALARAPTPDPAAYHKNCTAAWNAPSPSPTLDTPADMTATATELAAKETPGSHTMMILRTPDHVFIGDEVDIATQILGELQMPLTPERLKHLAVAILGHELQDIRLEKMS